MTGQVRELPDRDVICWLAGMLFARPSDPCVIVQSSVVGMGQHDPTTWQVMHSSVKEALALQPDCVALNDVIASRVVDVSLAECEQVTNEAFDDLGG